MVLYATADGESQEEVMKIRDIKVATEGGGAVDIILDKPFYYRMKRMTNSRGWPPENQSK
jgi:hypothetical protein